MTLIEIRPFRNGWKCFEAPGVEPVFQSEEDAIDYAQGRACFRFGEILVSSLHRQQSSATSFDCQTSAFHFDHL
jgi:hypothetical protein